LAAVLAVAGCGDGKIKRFPVHGSVTVDGQPADGAMVIFCPVNPNAEVEMLRPSAKADSTGAFNLMTFDAGDGAPAGEYKVLVKWPAKPKVDARDGRPGAPGPDRLRGKYNNQDTTPFTAKVDGPTELPPFALQSK
jgi:hypothetical protein